MSARDSNKKSQVISLSENGQRKRKTYSLSNEIAQCLVKMLPDVNFKSATGNSDDIQ